MPVSTDALNEDIKELRGEVRDGLARIAEAIQSLAVGQAEMKAAIRAEIHAGDDGLRADLTRLSENFGESRGEIRIALRVAAWGGMLLAATLVTGGAAAIFWAGRIDGQVKGLVDQFEKAEKVRIISPPDVGPAPVPPQAAIHPPSVPPSPTVLKP